MSMPQSVPPGGRFPLEGTVSRVRLFIIWCLLSWQGVIEAPSARGLKSARFSLIGQYKDRIFHPPREPVVVHEQLEEFGVILHDRGHLPHQYPVVFGLGDLLDETFIRVGCQIPC